MSRTLSNIEKSTLRHGEYVGHADGPWHIKRDGSVWAATKQFGVGYETAPTLARLSNKLSMHQFQATIAKVSS